MLRLEQIVKIYKTSDTEVHALKGVDLAFRKSEFVSILGPSGCGKTTLLNIIGGLDHYTSGDLHIEGKSTKEFKSHDWDVYRNHRIGFVFQSYNLIPHQNILTNVELALSIGGLKKKERTEKAKKALDRVGLEGLYKKKPNQLSGGQCQRVAIARALVNEPDILLADEPTGALDSETSVQIMDLIKEISSEKLVIMVTHNPILAEKYSTRIINLLDGEVVGDSNPYSLEEEQKEVYASVESVSTSGDQDLNKAKAEKAKMSWWTAFKLSGNNLLTKAKRTAMIVVASSIGIVGVSAVLSLSFGVRDYVTSMQDDMLSGNPVQIAQESLDLSSLTDAMSGSQKSSLVSSALEDGYIDIDFLVEQLVSMADSQESLWTSNSITADYVQFVKQMPSSYYSAIAYYYGLDVTNNIYTQATINTSASDPDPENDVYSISSLAQIATSIVGQTSYGDYASLASSYTDVTMQCLDNKDYVLSQYDVVAGHYPTEENEMMIVLNSNDAVTEFFLTLAGYYSQDQFLAVIDHFGDTDYVDDSNFTSQVSFDDLMSKTFTYYPNDEIFGVSVEDRRVTYSYRASHSWDDGLEMKVVGILTPKDTISYGCLSTGLYYTPAFAQRFIEDGLKSNTVALLKYVLEYTGQDSFTSYVTTTSEGTTASGIYYDIYYNFNSEDVHDYGLVGTSNSLSGISSLLGSSGVSYRTASLTLNNVGGSDVASTISIYPKSFNEKYLVTEYLDKWNSEGDITLNFDDGTTKTLTLAEREEITYTDNLQVIINLINSLIDIVTIALVCFSALALVVSTVMIGIITYVSVMERVKEIGVIRAMGGRKKDVSHLFNAETFIIGIISGSFGIAITYILQIIINIIVSNLVEGVSAISALPWWVALIMIALSIALTMIAGLIPSRSAANKDPVEALRSE